MRLIQGSFPRAAALLVALLAVSSRSTLWDRDEPRFGAAAREMAASGKLLTPTFNGELRAQKPALPTWLMASAVRLLGPREVAVRAWSAVALTAAALLAGSLGGPLAFLVLASAPLALVEGTAATADALLLAFLTGALAVLWSAAGSGWRARHVAGLGLLLGLAQLTKGPVGLALPLGAAAVARLLSRDGPSPRRPLLLAALLSVGVFGAWAVPANWATDGRYLAFGLGREVLARVVTPLEGHGGSLLASLPYYLPVLLLGFTPWTLYLPSALAGLVAERRDPRHALLLAWIVAPFALFTLVATKLPHYVLPAWPALAVAVARDVARAGEGPERWRRLGRVLFTATQAAIVCGLVAGAFLVPSLVPYRALLLGAAALTAAISLHVLGLHLRGAHVDAARRVGLASLVGMTAAAFAALPLVERVKPVPRLAARIPATGAVATLGFAEPSLDFYVGRPPIAHLVSADEARRWLASPGRGFLVLPRPWLARLDGVAGRELASESGFNLAKGEWVELVVLERNP